MGQLATPRVVWLMVPAAAVDATLAELVPLLARGRRRRRRRQLLLRRRHPPLRGAGRSGYQLPRLRHERRRGRPRARVLPDDRRPGDAVERLDPIFRALAPGVDAAPRTPGRTGDPDPAENGYLHCGPSGAGHFVKMVHNGIEYGFMAAYAEGLNILQARRRGPAVEREVSAEVTPLRDPELYQYQLDIPAVTEVWRRGSVVASWLLDLAAQSFLRSGDLSDFEGRVSDSGEGRWTSIAAIDVGAPAPVLTTALYERFTSRGEADFADRVLSAMRFGFGGHEEAKG